MTHKYNIGDRVTFRLFGSKEFSGEIIGRDYEGVRPTYLIKFHYETNPRETIWMHEERLELEYVDTLENWI